MWPPMTSIHLNMCRMMYKSVKVDKLEKIANQVGDYDVVAIDQGQFFGDIAGFCQRMANLGKIVIVAALDATFQRKAFGNIVDLLPIAETVHKLSAVCVLCYQ